MSNIFTKALPKDDPESLGILQCRLMSLAEYILGNRDTSKKIYQPIFTDKGPLIRNTPNIDGAFVELSRNAETYWPTVIFELAHETVHLLNPKVGNGTWLEEGIAVAFSIYAQQCYGIKPQNINMESYRHSLKLVLELPPDPLSAGRIVRDACGTLDHVTQFTLETLFPSVDHGTLAQLSKPFERDWSEKNS